MQSRIFFEQSAPRNIFLRDLQNISSIDIEVIRTFVINIIIFL